MPVGFKDKELTGIHGSGEPSSDSMTRGAWVLDAQQPPKPPWAFAFWPLCLMTFRSEFHGQWNSELRERDFIVRKGKKLAEFPSSRSGSQAGLVLVDGWTDGHRPHSDLRHSDHRPHSERVLRIWALSRPHTELF